MSSGLTRKLSNLKVCQLIQLNCQITQVLSEIDWEVLVKILKKINDVAFSTSQTLALARPESSEIGKSHKNSVHAVNSRPLLFRYCIPLKHCPSSMQIYSAGHAS